MTANMFVEIPKIPGDSTEVNHDKWIVIHNMFFELERAVDMTDPSSKKRSNAKTHFQKIEVTSQIGTASNKLALSVANGTVHTKIKLHVCRSGESASSGLLAYSVWTLKDAIIDKYSISFNEDDIPEETWVMAYTGIEHEYKKIDPATGTLSSENEFKWNLRTGKAK